MFAHAILGKIFKEVIMVVFTKDLVMNKIMNKN